MARDAFELGVEREPHGRRDAVLEPVHGPPDLLQHHLRRHVGRGVQARHRHLLGIEALGELEAGRDLRELALPVGAGAAVAVLDHRVVEVDRRLAERGDIDDAGRGGSAQQRQQAHGQQEARKVVDREAQLVAVLAHLPLPPVGEPRSDAGVVDQHVQLRGRTADVPGQVADLVEQLKVGQEGGGGHPAAAQRARLGIELGAVAPVHEHAGAAGVQLPRDAAAEPVRRAGDQHHGVFDRSHAVGRSNTPATPAKYAAARDRPRSR